jgi:hypothetical protein
MRCFLWTLWRWVSKRLRISIFSLQIIVKVQFLHFFASSEEAIKSSLALYHIQAKFNFQEISHVVFYSNRN